jgi:hypothetical protein
MRCPDVSATYKMLPLGSIARPQGPVKAAAGPSPSALPPAPRALPARALTVTAAGSSALALAPLALPQVTDTVRSTLAAHSEVQALPQEEEEEPPAAAEVARPARLLKEALLPAPPCTPTAPLPARVEAAQ